MAEVNFKVIIFLMLISGTVSVLNTNWWKHTIIYEIYIPSFKDSNGDGLGDIKGITQKLDHFVDLGIETIYISPFFKSPMLDFGYDISNFVEVDPLFGTLRDFDELIYEMKKRGLKLIMDLVINHSSEEHAWFDKSIKRIEPYTDFYFWVDAKGFDKRGKPIPPNNWRCLFGGSAWEWNNERRQFYLHQFNVKQPDLNLRSEALIAEIKNMMNFWMDRGVTGFRLDATMHYIEDKNLRNEPLVDSEDMSKIDVENYYSYNHLYTTNLWESYEFIHELRNHIDNYTKEKNEKYEKILVAEAYTTDNYTIAYYGAENYPITHFPFNFKLVGLKKFENASRFNNRLMRWFELMPKGSVANWVAENHDNMRIGSKFGEEYADIITITLMTLPGVACVYYGQEIGMINGRVRVDQRQDPNILSDTGDNRDGERLPMQWDNTPNAGFTSRLKPWLPVASNYWKTNVEMQKSDEFSKYNLFKRLSWLRKKQTMKFGSHKTHIVSEWVYAFTRSLRRHETYITIMNLGTEVEMIDLSVAISHLPKYLEIVAASLNAGYAIGDRIQTRPQFPNTFVLRPLSAIVASTKLHSRPLKLATLSTDG